jgi:hypothetical protein
LILLELRDALMVFVSISFRLGFLRRRVNVMVILPLLGSDLESLRQFQVIGAGMAGCALRAVDR